MKFIMVNEFGSKKCQRYLRDDHISAIDINQQDQTVTVYLVGGQKLVLPMEESKQLVDHIKTEASEELALRVTRQWLFYKRILGLPPGKPKPQRRSPFKLIAAPKR